MTVLHAPRWRLLVLGLVGCLAAFTGGVVSTTASASSPTAPASMVITSITSAAQAPSGTPAGAVPYVLVQAGGAVNVSVSFFDSSGLPASFNTDTTLSITSNRGATSPSTGVVLKDQTSATLTTSLATAANQVSITVSYGSKAKGFSATSSTAQLFDVLKELHDPASVPAGGTLGIGGDDDSCTNATPANPVCGILSLPFGASSQVVLSLGACDATYAVCGSSKGAVVQALTDLSGLGYSHAAPATLIVKCDKSLCGGGAIQKVKLEFSLKGNEALGDAPPCPAKFTIGADQSACVDYVQSKRDGSGDTHLYLLFAQDMRTSVG